MVPIAPIPQPLLNDPGPTVIRGFSPRCWHRLQRRVRVVLCVPMRRRSMLVLYPVASQSHGDCDYRLGSDQTALR
jgi:hypothetical protein